MYLDYYKFANNKFNYKLHLKSTFFEIQTKHKHLKQSTNLSRTHYSITAFFNYTQTNRKHV